MVEHLHTIGLRRFAVMYEDDPFGKSGLAGAETALAKPGLTAAAKGGYDPTKPEDIDATVAANAPANPDAIIMVSINRVSAAFVMKMRAKGSKARVQAALNL